MSRAFSSEEYEEKEIVYEDNGPVTHDQDIEFVTRFCNTHDPASPSFAHDLGMTFLKGADGFPQNDAFAVKWFRKSVKMGFSKSCLPLARLLLKDTKTNGYSEAAKLLEKARDSGESVPELDVLRITDPRSRSAYVTYRLNAENGDPEAAFLLAEGYEKSYYGKDKYAAAAKWYRIALKRGVNEAAERILELHEYGRITLSDEELRSLKG